MGFFKNSDLQRRRYEFGNGLLLNGTNQSGLVQNVNGLSLPPSFTILNWLKEPTLVAGGAAATLFGNYYRANPLDYFDVRLALTAGGVYNAVAYSAASSIISTIPGPPNVRPQGGRTLLVAFTRRAAGSSSLSLNGVITGTVTSASPAFGNMGTFRVGSSGTGGFTNGLIGELDFLPVALEADDLRRIWNGGRGSFFRDTTLASVQSLFRFKFDETSGTSALDSSGQSVGAVRHLTLLNAPVFTSF